MKECVKTEKEYGFRCEYCGREEYGSSAYGNIMFHEPKCVKNPAVIAAGRAAVGKMYKGDNFYVKVLQFNEDCSESNEFTAPVINGGFSPTPAVLMPEFKKHPLVVEEIRFGSWKSFDEWRKGIGTPISLSITRKAMDMEYNFQNLTEITQDEWNEALNCIIRESQL